MAFIPTTQTARVDLIQTLSDVPIDNTLWFFKAGGEWTVTELSTLGAAINSIMTTSFPDLHTTRWSYFGCVVADQQSEVAPAVNVPAPPTDGTVTGDVMPNNVAWCIKFLTAGRGRSSRGRNYFGGIPRSLVIENTLDATYAGSILTAYNRFLVPDLGLDAAQVVVSHYTGGAPRAAGLPQLVTSVTYTDLTLDTQRRRMP